MCDIIVSLKGHVDIQYTAKSVDKRMSELNEHASETHYVTLTSPDEYVKASDVYFTIPADATLTLHSINSTEKDVKRNEKNERNKRQKRKK